MITSFTKEDLISFENDIGLEFDSAKIKAPVHLDNGNEDQLIQVFQDIKEEDWIFCSWRSHYKCLLKGVPKDVLKEAIMVGKSISLCFSKYNIFSSAIVGGNIPIALGVAIDIKLRGGDEKVYCFVGDMTSETGIMWECFKYARAFKLPITFVIEDNNKSVCTDTRKTWGREELFFEYISGENLSNCRYYKYESRFPHAGHGKRVQF